MDTVSNGNNKNNKLIYLASLYSINSTPEIRQERYERVQELTALMLLNGYIVFSPITYNHPIAIKFNLPPGWEFWEPIDTCYINKCDEMLILKDDGWNKSVGITAEIEIAKKINKKIRFVYYERDAYWFEDYN